MSQSKWRRIITSKRTDKPVQISKFGRECPRKANLCQATSNPAYLGSMIDADHPFYACKYSTFCHRASPAFHMKPLGWRYAGLGPTWTMVTFKTFLQRWLPLQSSPTLEPPIAERSTTMSSHIKFAEPTSNKASKDRARGLSQEKGSAQRAPSPGNEIVYPTGWRLVLTTTGYVLNKVPSGVGWRKLTIYRLLIGFFLSNLDVTIVSSALTVITDDLQGFEKRSWIITGYLATYTGMIRNAIL